MSEIVYTYNKYTAGASAQAIDVSSSGVTPIITKIGEYIDIDAGEFATFKTNGKNYVIGFLYKQGDTKTNIHFCVLSASTTAEAIDDVHIWKCTTGEVNLTFKGSDTPSNGTGFFYSNSTKMAFGFYADGSNVAFDFYNPGKSFFLEGDHSQAIDIPAGVIIKDSN